METGTPKKMLELKVGDKIKIIHHFPAGHKSGVDTETFAGIVEDIRRFGRVRISVDIVVYIKGGYRRHRWKRKVKAFGDCPQYEIFLLGQIDPVKSRVAAQRKAFAEARIYQARRAAAQTSPYEVLQISETASAVEIKRAYRRMALKWHPDKNPGNKAAVDVFKHVVKAYKQLTNR